MIDSIQGTESVDGKNLKDKLLGIPIDKWQ